MTQGSGDQQMSPTASNHGHNGSRKHARGAKARQAQQKRAAHPWINEQVVSSAANGDLDLLLSTIEALLPQMNLVNTSTALHRLAKMTRAKPELLSSLEKHPLLVRLVAEVSAALETEAQVSAPRCQALSNITWALATMGIVDKPLLQALADLAAKNIDEFKAFELSTLLWAFAKLSAFDPAVRDWSYSLFQASVDYILQQGDSFTFRCQVMIVWSFATARQNSARLFSDIAGRMLPKISTASCQELANTAWAFSTVGVYEEALLSELASNALVMLSAFKPQELSIMLWSFAAIGFVHEDFFDSAALAACSMDLQAQHLANVLWAHSRMRPRHRTTQAALLALLPRCSQALASFKPQEFSSVALAAAKCFGHSGVKLPDSASPAQDAIALPPQVRDFFVSSLPWVVRHLSEFSGQSLANATNAFVAVQIGSDASLFQSVGHEVLRRVGTLETSALLVLIRCLPGAPQGMWVHGAIRMLLAEAGNRVDTMLPNEVQVLSKILNGLASSQHNSNGAFHTEVRDTCQALAASGAWATAVVSHVWDEPLDVPADLEGLCSVRGDKGFIDHGEDEASAENLEKDIGCKSDASTTDDEDAALEQPEVFRKQHEFSTGGMHLEVKNTFIERVLDWSDTDSTESEPEVLSRRRLPPPLDIIPAGVSREQLAAYRTDYQRFRAGGAVGAKGEVTLSTTGIASYW